MQPASESWGVSRGSLKAATSKRWLGSPEPEAGHERPVLKRMDHLVDQVNSTSLVLLSPNASNPSRLGKPLPPLVKTGLQAEGRDSLGQVLTARVPEARLLYYQASIVPSQPISVASVASLTLLSSFRLFAHP